MNTSTPMTSRTEITETNIIVVKSRRMRTRRPVGRRGVYSRWGWRWGWCIC